MRRLPTKEEILRHAKRIELSDILMQGLPAITPEEHELKESGAFQRARINLMQAPETRYRMEQRKYVDEMASEMGLKVIPKKELRFIRRKTSYEWTNGWSKKHTRKDKTSAEKAIEKTVSRHKKRWKKITEKHKPKKKRKRHIERTGKTMRKLRKVKGVKVFSFPDHIWKVNKKR